MEDTQRYEISFLSPKEESLEEVAGLVQEHGGINTSSKAPLRTRFAYSIKKFDSGYLSLIEFDLPKDKVVVLRESLRHNPGVIRFEISKVAKEAEGREREREPEAAKENELSVPPLVSTEQGEQGEGEYHRFSAHRHVELSNEALHKKLEEMLQ